MTILKSSFTKNVEKKLKHSYPAKYSEKDYRNFFVGEDSSKSPLTYLGHSIPDLKKFMQNELAIKGKLRRPDLNKQMHQLWQESTYFEGKLLAVYWLSSQETEYLIKNLNYVKSWSTGISNWASSDTYCSALARIFETAPNKLLPTYKKWNSSKNPWLRRCSMVGLVYYSSLRKKHPSCKLMLDFIKPNLTAQEYYVQKAVGWTIRECYNIYPEKTFKFIEENVHIISSHAWYASTEKFSKRMRLTLLAKRKARQRNKV